MEYSYEDVYRRVYEAGGNLWEQPTPTEELVKVMQKHHFPKGAMVIDFGCGEGRDSIFLAKSGFKVTGVDSAPSAILKARERAAQEGVKIDFRVGDVTALNKMSDEYFDLGVNIGCLHMFSEHTDRRKHLSEAFRILKSNALFFLCNMAEVTPEEVRKARGDRWKPPKLGELTPTQILVNGEEKEVLIPTLAGYGFTEERLRQELSEAGFNILEAHRKRVEPVGISWVMIAQKEVYS